MAEIIYSTRALESLGHAVTSALPGQSSAALAAIGSAVTHLAAHPLVGRRVESDLRELIISFGETGYVALYRFVPQRDQVFVLALRHQRDLGYVP